MANINRVVLVGNLTRDPELRHTPSGTAPSARRWRSSPTRFSSSAVAATPKAAATASSCPPARPIRARTSRLRRLMTTFRSDGAEARDILLVLLLLEGALAAEADGASRRRDPAPRVLVLQGGDRGDRLQERSPP